MREPLLTKITSWHRARPILGTAQVKSVQELKTRASNHTLSKIRSFSVLAKKMLSDLTGDSTITMWPAS